MRQSDTDTNGRNLRFVLVADPGQPSEMARDLTPRLPEDLRRRIARGIRWQADTVTAPPVADEQVDVAHVAEIVGTRLEDGDWYIGVFLTDLPSRMERNPVSTEFERERRVATGRAGRRAAGPSPASGVSLDQVRSLSRSAC
ncbi:hypothetical protein ACFTZF_41965 [Streptomyces mirabilis]|uniref:hypothetical protein n=1 Tax=Streptomyces mirabilis TaxID=68239 RepID=UPI003634FE7F